MPAVSQTSTSGCAASNRPSRGISHLAVKEGAAVTVTRRPSTAAVRSDAASDSRSNASRSAGSAVWAESVRRRPRAVRRNRAAPIKSSRFWICWLTAPGVTDSSSAAREKFMWRGRGFERLQRVQWW